MFPLENFLWTFFSRLLRCSGPGPEPRRAWDGSSLIQVRGRGQRIKNRVITCVVRIVINEIRDVSGMMMMMMITTTKTSSVVLGVCDCSRLMTRVCDLSVTSVLPFRALWSTVLFCFYLF